MGELISSSLFGSKGDECGKCGMKKHTEDAGKDCCKDVCIVVKSGDLHTFSQTVCTLPAFQFISPLIPFLSFNFSIPRTYIKNLFRPHSPPALHHPLFILLQTFRI
jgi:hypothetical protein